MKIWKALTAASAALLLLSATGAAVAKDNAANKSGCAEPQPSASAGANAAPATVQGRITAIDHNTQMITVQGADGKTHQFRANPDDLKNFKVGDELEAKRRTPSC